MHTYSRILWIFSVLFNVCTPNPLAQIAPYDCGQGLIYANGQCITNGTNIGVINPVPVVEPPCTTTDQCCSCQTTITQTCQTTQCCQPGQPCQAAQPCQVTQPCQTTQPCPVQQCQTCQACQSCTSTQSCQPTQTCQAAVTQPCPTAVQLRPIPPIVYPPPIIYPYPPTPAPPQTTVAPPTTTTIKTSPAPIIEKKCPPGTILINNYCHLIYCGSGIYRDGKCTITVCPEGTIWTGSRCQQPEPQNQKSLYISNVINTNVDYTSDNHVINYVNNLVINVTDSPNVLPPPPPSQPLSPSPPPPVESSSTSLPPPSNCCYIVTPQTCLWEEDQYQCSSRKYRRCGYICTAPYIYLRPPIVMPPPVQPCQSHKCEPFYPDCNTCDNMEDFSCQTYCQRRICQTVNCQTINLRGYCRSYPGAMGCRRTDGCMNDWCN